MIIEKLLRQLSSPIRSLSLFLSFFIRFVWWTIFNDNLKDDGWFSLLFSRGHRNLLHKNVTMNFSLFSYKLINSRCDNVFEFTPIYFDHCNTVWRIVRNLASETFSENSSRFETRIDPRKQKRWNLFARFLPDIFLLRVNLFFNYCKYFDHNNFVSNYAQKSKYIYITKS